MVDLAAWQGRFSVRVKRGAAEVTPRFIGLGRHQ
jgi:hypothetical protein